LRKPILAFGIILLLVGIIIASSSNLPSERIVYDEVASADKVWGISGSFVEGDIVIVDFSAGEDWWLKFVRAPTSDYQVPLNFTINGPSEGETIFQVYIGAPPGYTESQPSPGEGIEIPVGPRNIELVSQSSDLEVRAPKIIEIGGIIKTTGQYLVQVKKNVKNETVVTNGVPEPYTVIWPKTPPEKLRLLKEVYLKEYPHLFLLPIGAPLIVCGVAVSTWGAKRTSKGRQVKRKGTH